MENEILTYRWLGATQTLSTFSMLDCVSSQGCAVRRGKGRTFELPTDFDHVWERHTRSKVETDKFYNKPFDS